MSDISGCSISPDGTIYLLLTSTNDNSFISIGKKEKLKQGIPLQYKYGKRSCLFLPQSRG